MPFLSTDFSGLMVFEPRVFTDDRGYFFESYQRKIFAEAGITTDFIQDNEAKSTFGILRGLHYQLPPYAQAKLVRVVQGEVLDVVVDIRENSPTYGQHFSLRLSAENKKQLFIPRGFAHGYAVLSEEAIFCYKCDNYYSKAHEGGLRFDDPALGIDWQIDLKQAILSERDKNWPDLGAHRKQGDSKVPEISK
jgi:dTDP-4-dehydrorhamnose 3,5-epimerase